MDAKIQLRFDNVCRYIDDNLERPVRLEQLARVAHCSPYHFQRLFKAHLGLTPAKYIQHKRIRRAMLQLANRPSMSITDIAFEAGFDFAESFSHTFKKHFDITPTQFRKRPDWELWSDFIQKGKQKRMKAKDTPQYNVEIVEFPQTKVAALEHFGSPNTIMSSVETFIAWRRANNIIPPKSATYNIFYNDPEATHPDEFHMDLCCGINHSIGNNTQGVVEKYIPASTCAKVRYQGSEPGIKDVMDHLYGDWLARSDFELSDTPPFFERIAFFPDVKEHEAITDIYIPLKTPHG